MAITILALGMASGSLKGSLHMPRSRTLYPQKICVTWRGDKMDTQPFYVVKTVVDRMHFQLATVAGTRIHHAYRQAFSKDAGDLLLALCSEVRNSLTLPGHRSRKKPDWFGIPFPSVQLRPVRG
jgi:hypothetical protein